MITKPKVGEVVYHFCPSDNITIYATNNIILEKLTIVEVLPPIKHLGKFNLRLKTKNGVILEGNSCENLYRTSQSVITAFYADYRKKMNSLEKERNWLRKTLIKIN